MWFPGGVDSGVCRARVRGFLYTVGMGSPRHTLDDMRDFARTKGGDCVSGHYRNNKTKLLWRCVEGHEWWARPDALLRTSRPSWCATCAGCGRWTIEELQRVALQRGGACLSSGLEKMTKPVLWRCRSGHQWSATGQGVVAGHWCAKCARRRVRDNSGRRFIAGDPRVQKYARVRKDRTPSERT